MSISNNLSAVLTLNSAGGSNSPAPTDSFNSTVSVGTVAAGPIGFAVTSSAAIALPLSTLVATGVYNLMLAHTGAGTDPALTLDMKNTAAASSKITIQPGGRMYLYNCIVAVTGTGASNFADWTITCASSGSTTASLMLTYT